MGNGASNRKTTSSLLALSSAAVLAVYSAGYVRTRAAADRFAQQTEARVRPLITATRAATPSPVDPAAVTAAPAVVTPTPSGSTSVEHKTPDQRVDISSHRGTAASPARLKEQRVPAARVLRAPVVPAAPEAPAPPAPAAPEVSAPTAPEAPAAAAAPESPAAPSAPATPQYKDGTYLGWGTSRHGDIQAQVVIENGRIASATIAQCLTRYSCSVIARLPPQVAERQSPEVDYVSGATQSTNAFYYAVVEALAKAK